MPSRPFSECSGDVHARRDVVGDERRHPDAEIDVVAVLQLPSDARNDAIPDVHG